jgi:P63C domain
MNIAEKIIEKFGGQTALAALLGKGQSTIQHWAKTGVIPAKWQSQLVHLAKEKGIELTAADFFDSSVSTIPSLEIQTIPKATHWGSLEIGESQLPCYVLDTGERVFSLKGAVVGLIGVAGGQLAEYIKVSTLKPYLPEDLVPDESGTIPALINFDTGGESFSKYALGLPVEKFMDLCAAYSTAADKEQKLTQRQAEIAIKANMFLRACAKVGIVALVDEVTGFQYDREQDALQFKLKLYLADSMRTWEKTFPDQLWIEFGRLTKWKGSANQRPKYWGKLVMELVYGYLDKDVADWLKINAPKPIGNMSYHRWLSSQYGLKRLIEHIWMLIGMASACETMPELRQKMAQKFGRVPMQLTLFLPPPSN